VLPSKLILTARARADLERWECAGYPRETCGLLVGRATPGARRVLRVVRARNRAAHPEERYELDPGDHVAADREARVLGLSIVGFWHSHPDHPAVPSESDRSAAWEHCSYLIASVSAREVEELRSWITIAGAIQEEELVWVELTV